MFSCCNENDEIIRDRDDAFDLADYLVSWKYQEKLYQEIIMLSLTWGHKNVSAFAAVGQGMISTYTFLLFAILPFLP